MTQINDAPLEGFSAITRRLKANGKKLLIVEGKDDKDVCHFHFQSNENETRNIIVKEVAEIRMPQSVRKNTKETILINKNIISESTNVAAIVDNDIETYNDTPEITADYINYKIFCSCGYSIENYALFDTQILLTTFLDSFGSSSNIDNWQNAISNSIMCFSSLSNTYSKSSSENYTRVRNFGNDYFQLILREDVALDQFEVKLNELLISENLSLEIENDVEKRWKIIDGKLISKCIKLAFFACNATNDQSEKEIKRRYFSMIGQNKNALHLEMAIESLNQ